MRARGEGRGMQAMLEPAEAQAGLTAMWNVALRYHGRARVPGMSEMILYAFVDIWVKHLDVHTHALTSRRTSFLSCQGEIGSLFLKHTIIRRNV